MPLETVLESLDEVLKPKARKQSAAPSLQPLAKLLGREVHPELVTLWRWGRATEVIEHPTLEVVAAEREEWWWTQVWLDARSALSSLKELREVPGFPPTLVPIATDEAGNFTCHDAVSGKLVDWDHETRKSRKLPGSLPALFTTVLKLAQKESRAKDKAPAAPGKPTPPGTAPTRLRDTKAPVLRKLSASHKLHGFSDAALSPDGKLAVGLVYGTSTVVFGDLVSNTELIPREPSIAEQHRQMGFVLVKAGAVGFDGSDRLLWRQHDQLSFWSWREGALSLETGARWTKGQPDYRDKIRPRLRGSWLALAVNVREKLCLALWPVGSFPQVKSLAGATSELRPKTVLSLRPWEGRDLFFDLDEAGGLVTLDSPGYLTWSLTRWDGATGKRLAQQELEELDAVDCGVSADGARILVLTRGGELLVFDRALKLEQRLPAHGGGKQWCSGLLFDPSGERFVTSAQQLGGGAGELSLWDARTLKVLARTPVKDAKQGFQVRAVGRSAVLTTSPLALFELR